MQRVFCNKICKAMRSCGRHICGQKCCPIASNRINDVDLHICPEVCGRLLNCKKHRCDLLCHSGRCLPCHLTRHERYICECGKTTKDPPILCSEPLPKCPFLCSRERPCQHPSGHLCHDRNSACPPCTFLVERMCAGNHGLLKNVLCGVIAGPAGESSHSLIPLSSALSCGKTCNKSLPCGNHFCSRICHNGPCIEGSQVSASFLVVSASCSESKPFSCGQRCDKRLPHCQHRCRLRCHLGECPRTSCEELVPIESRLNCNSPLLLLT